MVTMIKYHEVRPWKIKECLMGFWIRGANWTHLRHFWYIYIYEYTIPPSNGKTYNYSRSVFIINFNCCFYAVTMRLGSERGDVISFCHPNIWNGAVG